MVTLMVIDYTPARVNCQSSQLGIDSESPFGSVRYGLKCPLTGVKLLPDCSLKTCCRIEV